MVVRGVEIWGEEGNKVRLLEQRLVNSEDWLGERGEPWKK